MHVYQDAIEREYLKDTLEKNKKQNKTDRHGKGKDKRAKKKNRIDVKERDKQKARDRTQDGEGSTQKINGTQRL